MMAINRTRFHGSSIVVPRFVEFVEFRGYAIEDAVFGAPLIRVNGPGMDRAVPSFPLLLYPPFLYRFVSRAQSFKGIKEGRWRRRRAAQRACESKRGGKFRREYIKQLLVSSFSRGGHRRDRTERRGFHLRYETASGSPLLLSPSPLQVTLGNGFRFLSLNA